MWFIVSKFESWSTAKLQSNSSLQDSHNPSNPKIRPPSVYKRISQLYTLDFHTTSKDNRGLVGNSNPHLYEVPDVPAPICIIPLPLPTI